MHIRFIILFLLMSFNLQAQHHLRINEVCSANTSGIKDEDNDNEDWIEIYNFGTESINLSSYYLSDQKNKPFQWQFPDIILLPEEYLLVFASKKDRSIAINHWETAVFGDSLWKYKNPSEETLEEYLTWNELDYNDEAWAVSNGAFGIGYDNISTTTTDGLHSIYLRKEFHISDTSKILSTILHAYYDDGFTAYLNGYEILRINMYRDGIKPEFNKSAFRPHLSKIDTEEPPDSFSITPHILKQLLKNGKNVLAIQNHNFWDNYPLVIKPWLSFSMADTNKQFDSIAPFLPTSRLPLHCNFSLSSQGEKLYLNDSLGYQVQEINILAMPRNISFGYHSILPDSLVFFSVPTPGFENNTAAKSGIIYDSLFAMFPSGLYKDSIKIKVINPLRNLNIRYTLDGSIPNDTADLYIAPFYLDTTIVLRIGYQSDSLICGPISNYSYFVNDSSTLPRFSLITDPYNLWDNDYGIYAFGDHYYNQLPYFEANFWQDWERPVYIQQFSQNDSLLWQQQAGIKIHGNYSRSWPQKSFGLYAKSEYGNSSFKELEIPQKSYLLKNKRFLLRNAGNDFYRTHLRDLLIQSRMQNEDIDIQMGEPVTVYLNGQYWGVYHLREKIDRFYLRENQGVNTEEINLLEQNGLVIDGERNSFVNLLTYIQQNDLSQQQHYQYIQQQIDIENWTNNLISNFYHMNTDWPHHNTKFWNAPDRKWRQILVDQDVSMGYFPINGFNKNPFPRIHEDSLSYLAIFYQELIKNKNFKRDYANRFSDLMNTIFLPEKYHLILDSLVEKMTPEMQRHALRWNRSYNYWLNTYLSAVRAFINERSDYMRDFLREEYDLGANDTITISHSPNNKGYIKLNSIDIQEQNWTGLYFDSVAVSLEAIPNPGYEFVGWLSPTSPELADSARVINKWLLKSHDSISALFYSPSGQEDTLKIAFTEINYRSYDNAEAGDWIEILNLEEDTIDLSSFYLKGLKPYKSWILPENTKIAPQGRLVIVQDTLKFRMIHPNITSFVGPFNFGIQSITEELSIWDNLDRMVSEIRFSGEHPWPNNEKTAKTIELKDDDLNYHIAENWQLGCPGGSPGLPPQDCQIQHQIIITEINYKSDNEYETSDWVEIRNNDLNSIDASNWIFRDGNDNNTFVFPSHFFLEPNQMLVLAQDTHQFYQIHEQNEDILGPFWFGLSSKEEKLSLSNKFNHKLMEVEYSNDSPWPNNVDDGYTIELSDFSLDYTMGDNWASTCFLGTPLQAPHWCIQANSILISEVKYHSDPNEETGDWIELYNNNEHSVNLLNWSIVFKGDTLLIDTNYILNAKDYVVLMADSISFTQFHSELSSIISLPYFDLDKEEAILMVLNPYRHPGNILSYHHQLNWPVFQTDTNNRTLELIDMDQSFLPESWRCGCEYGTPTLSPDYCDVETVYEVNNMLYKWSAYPNPAQHNIWVEIQVQHNENYSLELLNMQSHVLFKKNINYINKGDYRIKIPLIDISSGIYILQLKGNRGTDYQKIIKVE